MQLNKIFSIPFFSSKLSYNNNITVPATIKLHVMQREGITESRNFFDCFKLLIVFKKFRCVVLNSVLSGGFLYDKWWAKIAY